MRETSYVGRVGALAAALGVGWAMAMHPGAAWADSDTTTPESSPISSIASGAQGAEPESDRAGEAAKTTGPKESNRPTGHTVDDAASAGGGSSEFSTHLTGGVTISSSGGSGTHVGTGRTDAASEPAAADNVDVPAPVAAAPGAAQATPAATAPVEAPSPSPEAEVLSRNAPSPVHRPAEFVSAAITSPQIAPARVVAAAPAAPEAPVAAPVSSRATSLTNALPAAAPAAVAASLAPTPGCTICSASMASAAPAVFLKVAVGLLATAVSPFLAPSPVVPTAPTPTVLAVLAWIRRETQRAFFNQAPTVSYDSATNSQSATGVLTGHLTVTDSDGDPSIVTLSGAPSRGTVDVRRDGSFTYTPDAALAAAGGTDTFTVTATNTAGGLHLQDVAAALLRLDPVGALVALLTPQSARAVVTVTVSAANQAPVTTPTTATTKAGTQISGQLSATDADGDPLVYSGSGPTSVGSTYAINPTGVFTYFPAANFVGTDTFTYTVTDGQANTTGTVTVIVTAVNNPPVTTPITVTTPEDTQYVGQLTATDADGDDLTYSGNGTTTAGGRAVFTPGGTFNYFPAANFTGTDTFTYTVTDGQARTTGTVTVTVTPVNNPPVLTVGPGQLDPATGATRLMVSAIDSDGGQVVVSVTEQPAHGTVTVDTNGIVTYVPEAAYAHALSATGNTLTGTDGFTLTAVDGRGGTSSASATVTITPTNTDPVYRYYTESRLTGISEIVFYINVADPDNDMLTPKYAYSKVNGRVTAVGGTGLTFSQNGRRLDVDARAIGANPGTRVDVIFELEDGHGGGTGPVQVSTQLLSDYYPSSRDL